MSPSMHGIAVKKESLYRAHTNHLKTYNPGGNRTYPTIEKMDHITKWVAYVHLTRIKCDQKSL